MYLYIEEILKFRIEEQQNQFFEHKNGRKQRSGKRLGSVVNLSEIWS